MNQETPNSYPVLVNDASEYISPNEYALVIHISPEGKKMLFLSRWSSSGDDIVVVDNSQLDTYPRLTLDMLQKDSQLGWKMWNRVAPLLIRRAAVSSTSRDSIFEEHGLGGGLPSLAPASSGAAASSSKRRRS